MLSKEVDFDDSMPLKQTHCVEHAHRRGWLWRHHLSRLTVWTHSQLLITHISALHFTLVLCNCLIPQCSQLTGFSHALHAILSVLTTYGELWSQLIFSAMQMLCTDKVYRGRRRCQELNAIEADSLTEQVSKRSIFKHAIEAGSLSQIGSLKRSTDNAIEAGSLGRTGRQCHCDDLCLNLVWVLVLSLFWGGRGSGSDSVSTELHVLVLGQTLNHWVVCSGWVLNCWVVCSGVVHSVSRILTRLICSVSHDSSRLVCSSSGFLVAAI